MHQELKLAATRLGHALSQAPSLSVTLRPLILLLTLQELMEAHGRDELLVLTNAPQRLH